MYLLIAWLVFLFVCSSQAQQCLPVVTLNNATLTQIHDPLTNGNFFEAQVVNPAKYVPFP